MPGFDRAKWPWRECLWNDGAGLCQLPCDLLIRHQEVTGQQLISALAWVPLTGHLPDTFCLLNSAKISLISNKIFPTDLWQHLAPTFYPDGLSLSPLVLFTQVFANRILWLWKYIKTAGNPSAILWGLAIISATAVGLGCITKQTCIHDG